MATAQASGAMLFEGARPPLAPHNASNDNAVMSKDSLFAAAGTLPTSKYCACMCGCWLAGVFRGGKRK